jgi:4-amino-4-deoxy-L-arabinose transferase-like glycosyltransferase
MSRPAVRVERNGIRVVVAAAVVAGIAALFLASISTSNPPGFYRDESNISLNAATIAKSARDQHGALLPLYFSSFGDWKSAPYIYVLSGVFAVTGPSELAARALSATLGLGAVALLGLLGLRLSGRRSVGVATAALAAATPWVFEVTRLVFEVSLEPLLVAAFLVMLAGVRDRPRWSLPHCAALGSLLALIAYTYAAGRGLAPLLALALAVFATRERWRSILWTWIAFGIALLPMALFEHHHPGALFVRYHSVNATAGKGILGAAETLAVNVFHDSNLWRWATSGDENPRHHVQGTGSLLLIGVVLALAGLAVLIRRRKWDPFWLYVVLGAGASVVPSAVTIERIHSLRSIALPVFLVTLAVPAIAFLAERSSSFIWRATALAIVAAGAAQFVVFQLDYRRDGPKRLEAFHAGFPHVFRDAAATRRPVVVYLNDYEALGNAQWYGRLWKIPVREVPAGRAAPRGSVVVANLRRCPTCRTISRGGMFTAYLTSR